MSNTRTFYRIAHKNEDLFTHKSEMFDEDLVLDGVCAFDSVFGLVDYWYGLFNPKGLDKDNRVVFIFKGVEIMDAGGDGMLGYIVEPLREDYLSIPIIDFLKYHKETILL